MIKENIKHKKGFTIIEVVLVLAIAGLIFLMVFIALPALQRGQRNTEREEHLSRFLTAVTDYAGNNSGRIPFDGGNINQFVIRYIDGTCKTDANFTAPVTNKDACTADQFRDPDGTIYHFTAANIQTGAQTDSSGAVPVTMPPTNDHSIHYALGFMCGPNEGTVIKGTGPRQVALLMTVEGGGISCNANS